MHDNMCVIIFCMEEMDFRFLHGCHEICIDKLHLVIAIQQ